MSNLQYLSASGCPRTDDAWTRVFDVNKYQSYLADANAEIAGHLHRSSGVDWQPKLKDITSQNYNNMHGTNPHGDADRMCNQAFVMHLHKTSQSHLAERHWMVGVLPTDELVRRPGVQNPLVYYVLWRVKRGCLAWTMEASTAKQRCVRIQQKCNYLALAAQLGLREVGIVIPSRYTSLGCGISTANTQGSLRLMPLIENACPYT
eukprot:3680757-Amphidinium_carterae.2